MSSIAAIEGRGLQLRNKPPAGNSYACYGAAVETGFAMQPGATLCKTVFAIQRAGRRQASALTERSLPASQWLRCLSTIATPRLKSLLAPIRYR